MVQLSAVSRLGCSVCWQRIARTAALMLAVGLRVTLRSPLPETVPARPDDKDEEVDRQSYLSDPAVPSLPRSAARCDPRQRTHSGSDETP